MNKNLVIFGITILLICVGLCGCFGDENGISEQDYFIGKWVDDSYTQLEGENNPKMFMQYIFYVNGSLQWTSYFSDDTGSNYMLISWQNYLIRDGKLNIEGEIPDTGQPIEICFKYKFLKDYKQIRLEDCNNSSAINIINKIDY
jgi:hypothetical protein